MDWQPTLSVEIARKRAQIIAQIRAFFHDKKVLEVETPALSQGTITDVHIEALDCHYNYLQESAVNKANQLYLQTSPEFAMKRLLASGYGDIFQICKAYRHEPFGRYHNPEFTLLEWYRLGFDHFQLMDEVAELLSLVLKCEEPEKLSYQQVFLHYVNIDPLTATTVELLHLLESRGKLSDWIVQEDDTDLLLQLIFSELIEPQIGKKVPCFIYHFPRTQAALAKISPIDNRVAERFECYYKGIELVNGFHELTDAKQQQQRFEQDNQIRKLKGLAEKPIDKKFIAALQTGLPACSGVALGIDRLIMLACNCAHISDVISFPINRS